MKISIVGLGWLGIPLAKNLIKSGNTVVGTTTSVQKKKSLEPHIKTSIFNYSANKKLDSEITKDAEVAIITIPPTVKYPIDSYGNHLLNIASQFPLSTKFIFTSSTSVYPKTPGIYSENSITNNDSPVRIAEIKLSEFLGQRLTILRLGGLFGESRHPVFSLQGRNEIKNPNGVINFVHLHDVIESIELLISKLEFGSIFNIVNPLHPNRKEYYQELVSLLNLKQIAFEEETQNSRLRIIDSSKYLNTFNTTFKKSIYPPFE